MLHVQRANRYVARTLCKLRCVAHETVHVEPLRVGVWMTGAAFVDLAVLPISRQSTNRREKFSALREKSLWRNLRIGAQCKETETFEAYVIGTAPAVYLGIVTTTRQSTWSVLLITGLLALMGGPLFAAAPHEVCDAMHHSCAKLEAVTSCCCGDRSDANPSQVPSGRTDVPDYGHAVTVAAVTFHLPTVTIPLVQVGAPLLERPPDLRILFSDLRI